MFTAWDWFSAEIPLRTKTDQLQNILAIKFEINMYKVHITHETNPRMCLSKLKTVIRTD